MKRIRKWAVCLLVLIGILLLSVGCQSTDKSPSSATTDDGGTSSTSTTTGTQGNLLLQGPDDTEGQPTADRSDITTTTDNSYDLFGPEAENTTTTGRDTPANNGSTTSTPTGGAGSSNSTSATTSTTTTTGQGGVSTSPYDNESNWVDGPIPTRK